MDVLFPSKGFYPNASRENQPGNTTPSCLNVLPFDRDFRARGAPRPGLTKFLPDQFSGAANPIQLLKSTPIALQASSPSGTMTPLALPTPPIPQGVVNAVYNGTYAGQNGQNSSALYWSDASTFVSLSPATSLDSVVNDMNSARQVGLAGFSGPLTKAGYWTGTAGSWTLLPFAAGSTQSGALSIDAADTTIGGYMVVAGSTHAGVWKQTSPGTWAWTDLTSLIPSYSSTYIGSEVTSCDGTSAVVICTTGAGGSRGFLINLAGSSASALGLGTGVDIIPTDVVGGIVVGTWLDSGGDQFAALWAVSAPGVLVDMSPPGSTGSRINSTNGSTHAGFIFDGSGNNLPAAWSGTSNVAVQLVLTGTYTQVAFATAIDATGVVGGAATNTAASSALAPVVWTIGGSGIVPPIEREVILITVCNGDIFGGTVAGGIALATGSSQPLSTIYRPQYASRTTKGYFVDTLHDIIQVDLPTMTLEAWVASAGTSETATTLGAYSLITMWRDRLVLAASVQTPQNFIMSRQGVPTDFDYGQDDSAAAVAGNASRVGSIGEPLNCLMPWTDDILILGGDHSIYKIEGDIAAGGQIVNVSTAIGTLGPDCWDTDPVGNLYFVGTDGLYMMGQNSPPQNISSGAVRAFFSNIDRTKQIVEAHWDRDRNGLYIFVTNISPGAASTHLWYDATNQAFFPVQYDDSLGPVVAHVYDGDSPLDRQVLLGGRDGYIRKVDQTALDDDGIDFENYVFIGPIRPGGTDAALAVLQALEVVVGEETAVGGFSAGDWGMSISVVTGKDAFTALTAPQSTFTFDVTSQSRRKRMLQRVSGGSWYFKISGDAGKIWSLEKLVPLFTPGGLQRRY